MSRFQYLPNEDTKPPHDLAAALDRLAASVYETPVGPERLELASTAVARARAAYRALPAEAWETAFPVGEAVVRACDVATGHGRITLDGRQEADLFRERLEHSLTPDTPEDSAAHSDAEVFFGFLGIPASRSCKLAWEVAESGDDLVTDVFRRIHAAAEKPGGAREGVHWSFALLERVRRAHVDERYVMQATRLLRRSVGIAAAGRLLSAYVHKNPSIAEPLLTYAESRVLLDEAELVRLFVTGLERALQEATSGDLSGIAPVCHSMGEAGVKLDEAHVRALETSFRVLLPELRRRSGRRQFRAHVEALRDLVAPIALPAAARELEMLLSGDPGGVAVAPIRRLGKSAVTLWRHRRARLIAAGVVLVASVGIYLMVSRATPPDTTSAAGPSTAVAAPVAALVSPAEEPSSAAEAASLLAEARSLAQRSDWAGVVALLTEAPPAVAALEAFARDSLVAHSALSEALRIGSDGPQHAALLSLARERSLKALRTVEPFAPGTDLLRLIHAEACILGQLGCAALQVTEDLIHAARSASPEIRARAGELLSSTLEG